MNRIVGFLLIATFALGSSSCDEKLSDITGPTPDLTPTFSSIQRNILTSSDSSGRAACNNCHTTAGGRVPPAGMDLGSPNAHAQLVNVPSTFNPGAIRVVPGDPENSYLIHKLEGRSGIVGLRMPRSGPPYLTEGQIRVIRRWIENGAPND
jgi:hypothetical protein